MHRIAGLSEKLTQVSNVKMLEHINRNTETRKKQWYSFGCFQSSSYGRVRIESFSTTFMQHIALNQQQYILAKYSIHN